MPRINFELTEEEKAILDSAAQTEHMQATSWARSFALRGARQVLSQKATIELVEALKMPFMQEMAKIDIPQFMELAEANEIKDKLKTE